MTEIERAIEYLEPLTKHPTLTGMYAKHLSVAVKALREQSDRINPKPLTLEELYQVDNEPLYLFCTVGKWNVNGWHIVEPINYKNASFKDLRLDHNDDTVISTFNYGNNYVAYRFPPKEYKP